MPERQSLDEVISYTAAEQFQSRPGYQPKLHVDSKELDRIVGKYSLPLARASWIECGLNGCNEPHRHGFVIRTHDGRETHCGNLCGRREFGVLFAEVEARAERAIESQSMRAVVLELLARKATLLERATTLVAECEAVERQVLALRGLLRKQNRFWQSLERAAKSGGAIRVEVPAPPDPTATGQGKPRTITVTLGILSGCSLIVSEPTLYSNVVRKNVIAWLPSVHENLPLDRRELAELSKGASRCGETIGRAERFLGDARRMLEAENLHRLQLIPDRVMRPADVTPLLRQVLDALSRGTPPDQAGAKGR
jgi:hypothetical protein